MNYTGLIEGSDTYVAARDVTYLNLDLQLQDCLNVWFHVYVKAQDMPAKEIVRVQQNLARLPPLIAAPIIIRELRNQYGLEHGPIPCLRKLIMHRNVGIPHFLALLDRSLFKYFNYWTVLDQVIKDFVGQTVLIAPEMALSDAPMPYMHEFMAWFKALVDAYYLANGHNYQVRFMESTTTQFSIINDLGYPMMIRASVKFAVNRDTNYYRGATWFNCNAEFPARVLNEHKRLPPRAPANTPASTVSLVQEISDEEDTAVPRHDTPSETTIRRLNNHQLL